MDVFTPFAIFFVGMVASVVGTLVGGGSLISTPFLIFLGLPPQVAIATDRFGGLGQSTALAKFWKSKKIIWKHVLVLMLLSLGGALIGANLLLKIDPNILKTVIGVLLLILFPLVFLKRNAGVEHQDTHGKIFFVGVVLYFVTQIYTGAFGIGSGPIIMYILVTFWGLTIVEASATQIIPVTVLDIASLIVFAMHGLIDYKVGIIFLLGAMVGGYLGAHIALKKGATWVKRLFMLLVIILAIKLLFFR